MEPRPTSSSDAASLRAATAIVAAINHRAGVVVYDVKHSVGAIQKAILAHPDAFDRGAMLRTLGFSVNQDVIDCLHPREGYERIALTEAEEEWTMRTGARFPAQEGDQVTVCIKYVYSIGRCEGVLATQARGYCRVDKGQPNPGIHNVAAEHVIKVWKNGLAVSVGSIFPSVRTVVA